MHIAGIDREEAMCMCIERNVAYLLTWSDEPIIGGT